MDYGYPQSTEARILREYITQEGYRMEAAPRPPTALTNAVSWRSEGIKHRKNEIFLDVVRFSNHRNRVHLIYCIRWKNSTFWYQALEPFSTLRS